jgi:DNA-directed RNA polymerase subunit RPC12/RpoP
MPKIQCMCNRFLLYREDQAGKRVKCPACSAKIVLPPLVGGAKAQPPGAAEAAAMPDRRMPAADVTPIATPRKEPPLAAQPGRPTPAHGTLHAPLKLDPADADIPLAGDVPLWGSDRPPDAAEAAATPDRRMPAQTAPAPIAAPRKEPPLAAQPGRPPPAHVMPNDALKLDPADADIPLAGDVPTWESEPPPDAPAAKSGPRATP